MKMNVKLTLILLLSCIVVIFIVQNAVVVDIRFLFWSVSMSRALMIFFVMAIGIVIGWVLRSYMDHKSERSINSG